MSTPADELNDPNIIYGGPLPADFSGGATSLGELIIDQLSKLSDKVALINGSSSMQLTYRGILEQSLALAAYLEEIGVNQNDVVAIVSENRFEYPITIYALMIVGAIPALLNPTYTQRELEHAIGLVKPKVIFISAPVYFVVKSACVKISWSANLIHFDYNETECYFQICLENSNNKWNREKIIPKPMDIENQVALIVMSSGTTGLPKGVQITQLNVMTTFYYLRSLLETIDANQPEMVTVSIGPWFHVAAGVSMLGLIVNGLRLVFLQKFIPQTFLSCIQQYRPTMLNLVPPLVVFLAKSPLVGEFDLSSVQTIICGAAPLSREVEDLIRNRLNISSVRQAYGMSETTLGVLMQQDMANKPGSVGRIRPGQWVKVIDPVNGRTLGPFQNGELCFKGSMIMKGYIGMEESFDKDGWLHTGDVGYYDDEKDFYIVDRLKELIKYNAFQVPPAELEAVLLSHPKVVDAAVVGIPDERVGELATAFVVPVEGEAVKAEEILNFVNSQMSSQKRLYGGVRFINEIPKTTSGKILRRNLREIAKTKSKL